MSDHRLPVRLAAASLLLAALHACAPSAPRDPQQGGRTTSSSPLTGSWGGDRVQLILSDSGGTLEYDCAHGAITEPVRTRADGHFEALGVHVPEHGGPVRIDEHVDSLPARYSGRVSGDRMTLRVEVDPYTLGPFELTRGGEARLVRCL